DSSIDDGRGAIGWLLCASGGGCAGGFTAFVTCLGMMSLGLIQINGNLAGIQAPPNCLNPVHHSSTVGRQIAMRSSVQLRSRADAIRFPWRAPTKSNASARTRAHTRPRGRQFFPHPADPKRDGSPVSRRKVYCLDASRIAA